MSWLPTCIKARLQSFGERLMQRYQEAKLPAGRPPEILEEGAEFPPPTFNLTSALHHVCGAAAFTFECSHGLKEDP